MTAPASSRTATVPSCPDCASALTDDARFVRWCRSCGWNAHPGAKPVKGFDDRFRRKQNRAAEERLHRKVTAGGGDRPSAFDGPAVGAHLLAGLVHLATLALAVGGVVVDSVPQSERDRRLVVSRLDDSAVDTSHPPTWLRLEFVGQLPRTASAITLTDAEAAAIDAELAPARAAVAGALGRPAFRPAGPRPAAVPGCRRGGVRGRRGSRR
ncbi:hypothetical protein [Streptacidiphilus sp. P02-A3a]|uniref:hypothetical protein n=1 Tax=Streptacidiphilus sp. P02-A3a TaxID=2704468 RepID=UPI0015F8E06E|nr:hypothetical protein [Streptacidiphilus sp. P02-A3a]QMU69675.1 hypothetical protein GXP74_16945 [Streptacidiphilus sp. P02-A3a]